MSTCSQVLSQRSIKIYNQQGRPKTVDDAMKEAREFDSRLLHRVHHLPMAKGSRRYTQSAGIRTDTPHHYSTTMGVLGGGARSRAAPIDDGVNSAISRYVQRRLLTKTARNRPKLRAASAHDGRLSPTDTLNDDLSSCSGQGAESKANFDDKEMGEVQLQSLLRRSTIVPIIERPFDEESQDIKQDGKTQSSNSEGESAHPDVYGEQMESVNSFLLTVNEHPEINAKPTQSSDDQVAAESSNDRLLQAPLSGSVSKRRRSSTLTGVRPEAGPLDDTALELEFGACGGRENTLKDTLADYTQKMKIAETVEDDVMSRRRSSAASVISGGSNRFMNLSPIYKLRRAIKTISLLLKATTTSTEQSKRQGAKFMTSSGGGGAGNKKGKKKANIEESKQEELDFDISYFKARREKSLCVDAIRVLKTHPRMRTEEQIHTALIALNETVEAFGEFPVNMQESLVRVGWYERYGAKRVIIRQSHAAQNFYFIISGITVVTVAKKNDSGESFDATIAMLKKGNSFGELALMSGGKRNATVSCMDECELLSVTREDFIDIFMNLAANSEPEYISFLREVPMLQEWPIDSLPYDDPKICLITYFRRGTVLCRNSNDSEWVYVIRTGSCFIMKDLPAMHDGIPRLKCKTRFVDSVGASTLETFEDPGEGRLVRNAKGKVYAGTDLASKIDGMQNKKRGGKLGTSERVFIKLKTLRTREVFGLEPLAFNCLGGTTGVTLVSDGAECVLINIRFFKNGIDQNYAKILRQELQPFPEIEDLEQKLQSHYNWNAYRHIVMDYYNHDKPKIHNFSPFT